MYGPTTGDHVRLGDTGLWIQVEDDKTVYGDECKFGGGKSLRDGQGQATNKKDSESLDLIVTNALIVDWTGIYKVRSALDMLRVISGADDLRCLFAGRYRSQGRSHQGHRQGRKSGRHGRRPPGHDRWSQYRGSSLQPLVRQWAQT